MVMMIYDKGMNLDRDVTVKDITSFVTDTKNECLPRIAHVHLAWADYLPEDVDEKRCMSLVKLDSDAVDYNNTRDLRLWMRPHLMEKDSTNQRKRSTNVHRRICDASERVGFAPSLEMPLGKRLSILRFVFSYYFQSLCTFMVYIPPADLGVLWHAISVMRWCMLNDFLSSL